jgi:hypothetical protein
MGSPGCFFAVSAIPWRILAVIGGSRRLAALSLDPYQLARQFASCSWFVHSLQV